MGYMCVLFVRACYFVYVVLIICGIQGIEGLSCAHKILGSQQSLVYCQCLAIGPSKGIMFWLFWVTKVTVINPSHWSFFYLC